MSILRLFVLLLLLGVYGEEQCELGSCQTNSLSLLNVKRSVKRDIVATHPVGDETKTLELSETDSTLTTMIQKAQHQSMRLSKSFLAAAAGMPEGATRDLFTSFKICGQCNSFQRWGEPNDGGYLMCMDGLSHDTVKAAYSLGVETHDKWSEDVMANLGVTVNQFDCTVDTSSCADCQFFKKCVVSADGLHPVPDHELEGWSLQQVLSETGQGGAPDGSLLMKMDIESSEWPIYASEPAAVLKKFGQLIVEFHEMQDDTRHQEYLQAMQHILDAGLKVVHLHGNNHGQMYPKEDGTSIPQVVEVTFVQGDARPNGCIDDQAYNGLDAPCNASAPELPMAHLR